VAAITFCSCGLRPQTACASRVYGCRSSFEVVLLRRRPLLPCRGAEPAGARQCGYRRLRRAADCCGCVAVDRYGDVWEAGDRVIYDQALL